MHRATPAATEPTLSVVIPVKDDAAELRRCLRALARQTLPPDEIIVVDNASTALDVLRAAPATVPGITIRLAAKKGATWATQRLELSPVGS